MLKLLYLLFVVSFTNQDMCRHQIMHYLIILWFKSNVKRNFLSNTIINYIPFAIPHTSSYTVDQNLIKLCVKLTYHMQLCILSGIWPLSTFKVTVTQLAKSHIFDIPGLNITPRHFFFRIHIECFRLLKIYSGFSNQFVIREILHRLGGGP